MSVDLQLQDIQTTLRSISEDMGFVKGSLKGMRAEQERIADYTAATSARVGVLEQKVSRLLGWAAGVALMVSTVFAFLKAKVFG